MKLFITGGEAVSTLALSQYPGQTMSQYTFSSVLPYRLGHIVGGVTN